MKDVLFFRDEIQSTIFVISKQAVNMFALRNLLLIE
jgi:hypothetical protein